MSRSPEDPNPTRATLLKRLQDWDDQASWQEFFDLYWKLIHGVARKAGLSESEAEDAVQETMVSVAKQMPTFKYDPALGSFKGWLLTITRWRIADQFRKRGRVMPMQTLPDETAKTSLIDKVPDAASLELDAIWETDWEKTMLEAAMSRIKSQLDPMKAQIFDFYVTREWPPEKVAQTFNVSMNQVYLVKNRVTEMLRDEVRRLEREAT